MKVAVLVISCDKYSDLWEPCTRIFNKFWPECPYDKYIATNTKTYNSNGFNTILIGEDKSWSFGLKLVLNELKKKYDYVFTLLEDYYFIEPLDNNYMVNMFESFMNVEGDFLRLLKILRPKLTYYNEYFAVSENFTPYRQTCVFTLWKINTLLEILKDDENAWEFEKIGVKRGFRHEKFFCVYENKFKVINVVIKGKLVPRSYNVLRKILPDVKINRPTFTFFEMMKMNFRDFCILTFLRFVPSRVRSKIYFIKNK